MLITKFYMFLFGFLFLTSTTVLAQFPVIDAEQVKSWMTGKKKVVLIDSRSNEEYQQAHIPRSLSVPAENMKKEASRLPRDKTTPIIFYCRGAG